MVMQIKGSVGASAKNQPDDVRTVQGLLNSVPGNLGGPPTPLAVDGFIGPLTIRAITYFQNKNFGWGDGRVDVGGQTIGRLNDFADGLSDPKSPVSAIANGGVPLGSAGVIDGAGKTKGDYAKVLSLVGTLFCNGGAIQRGQFISTGIMIWTMNKSSASLYMVKSGRNIFMPANSLLYVGQDRSVPLSSVQWTRAGASPASKPAPYQHVQPSVSPGYFRQ